MSLSNMADQEQKALSDYAMPSVNGAISSIRRPAIQANNFEIKPAIIQMIQQTVLLGGCHKRILMSILQISWKFVILLNITK